MSDILVIDSLRKEYPGVVAVDALSFTLQKGEVMALLGENGAGKSTTSKMICGVENPDAGTMHLDGQPCMFKNAHEAAEAGIGMVFQELSLVDSLSVAENIFMNRQPVNGQGMIDFKVLNKQAKEMLDIFGLEIKPQTKLGRLSTGNKQIVEILKAVSQNPKILILDEPTSSLTDVEIEKLFEVVDKLKKDGMSFIYISHKLNEIFRLCDAAVIMRDGKFVASKRVADLTEESIVSLMVGREIKDLFGKDETSRLTDEKMFSIEGVTKKGQYTDVSFHVNKGEIVGIFGLIGSGRTELAEGIIGYEPFDEGIVKLGERQLSIDHPHDAIMGGIGYVTEDRKELGLYLQKTIRENLVVNSLGKFSQAGILDDQKMSTYSDEVIKRYGVAAYSAEQEVGKLSGGNQQKILLAMWLEIDPAVMIFDEPTRGVDIGAKSEIYAGIRAYAMNEKATIVISSELPELIGLCDRIMVMRNGSLVGEIVKNEFSEETIVGYATGVYQ